MSECQEELRFRERYERHVCHVVAGDTQAALADMLRGVMPAVYDGVTVPPGITGRSIVAVYHKDGKWYGETVYDTASGPVGLLSVWWPHDGDWFAAELENFPV